MDILSRIMLVKPSNISDISDQISSTNIGAIVTVRFNVASFEANLGDWAWVLAGVDPTFDVQDANAFINESGSGAVYTHFSEGCWFYFGQAAVLNKPFLCSRDPDAELSSLQSSTLNEPYQYGSLEFYSSSSGNLSIWYALDEQFDFAMVQSYYTCGIHLVAPASLVVRLSLGVAATDPMYHIMFGSGHTVAFVARVDIMELSCCTLLSRSSPRRRRCRVL